MRGIRARNSSDVLFGNAGWLFADLMLALVLMVLLAVATSAQKKPTSQPPPNPVTTTTTTTTTTPPVTTTPPRPLGLLPVPVTLDVYVDTEGLLRNDRGVIDAMRGQVGGALAGPLAGQRVGMALTFGSGPIAGINRATTVARYFNEQVLQVLGGQLAGVATTAFFQQDTNQSKITLWLYVFAS